MCICIATLESIQKMHVVDVKSLEFILLKKFIKYFVDKSMLILVQVIIFFRIIVVCVCVCICFIRQTSVLIMQN